MLHPVGDRPPSVYWIRRGMLLALVLLIIVSLYAVFFRGGGDNKPNAGSSFTATGPSTPAPTGSQDSSAATSTSPSHTAASSASTSKPCAPAQLSITAATSAKSYPAAAKPIVAIVVTNTGPAPCVQDLADRQIELRVYNGSARVWGSHDCAIAPGTATVTLPVNQPIRREVQWSGLSSQPACAGTRTRVGAGTYTLHASLAGREGKTSTFTLAG